MTFEQLWLSMVEKKPLLADPAATVTINVEVFKRMLRQFHSNGVEQGKAEPSLFDNIFGNFGKNHEGRIHRKPTEGLSAGRKVPQRGDSSPVEQG